MKTSDLCSVCSFSARWTYCLSLSSYSSHSVNLRPTFLVKTEKKVIIIFCWNSWKNWSFFYLIVLHRLLKKAASKNLVVSFLQFFWKKPGVTAFLHWLLETDFAAKMIWNLGIRLAKSLLGCLYQAIKKWNIFLGQIIEI